MHHKYLLLGFVLACLGGLTMFVSGVVVGVAPSAAGDVVSESVAADSVVAPSDPGVSVGEAATSEGVAGDAAPGPADVGGGAGAVPPQPAPAADPQPEPDGALAADADVPDEFRALIEKHGRNCSTLTPALLAAQIEAESGWNPKAKNSIGARGLGQFMPGTWDVYGLDANDDGKADPFDPEDAIASAAHYDCEMADVVAKVPGNRVSLMLAAYNAGAGRVIKSGGVPKISETLGYIAKIKATAKSFEG